MKVAYNGTYLSQSQAYPSCHTDTWTKLPAGGASTFLYFVNPWIDDTVFGNVYGGSTHLYVAAYSTNSLSTSIVFSWGQMVILTADSTPNSKAYYIGGPYAGIVYNKTGVQTFAGAGQNVTISPDSDFYLIFTITYFNFGGGTPTFAPPGDAFSGTATMNNGYWAQAKGPTFQELQVFLNGLFLLTTQSRSCTPETS